MDYLEIRNKRKYHAITKPKREINHSWDFTTFPKCFTPEEKRFFIKDFNNFYFQKFKEDKKTIEGNKHILNKYNNFSYSTPRTNILNNKKYYLPPFKIKNTITYENSKSERIDSLILAKLFNTTKNGNKYEKMINLKYQDLTYKKKLQNEFLNKNKKLFIPRNEKDNLFQLYQKNI